MTPASRSRVNLLVLSLHYSPEITGNAALMTELTRQLAARGLAVRVVAGTPHYRLAAVPPEYRRRLYVYEVRDGVQVTRCFAIPARNNRTSKIANYLTFLATCLPACLAGPKPDWILVVSPPFLLGLVGAVVKLLRGSKLMYNAQDLFPHAYVTGGTVQQPWLVHLMAGLQRWIYRWADMVTTIAPALVDQLAA